METVIHFEFKDKTSENEKNQYFGSVKAIYTKIPENEVGVSYDALIRRGFKSNPNRYENDKCIIRIGEIIRVPNLKKSKSA